MLELLCMCKLNSLYVVIMDTQGFGRFALCVPNMYKLIHLGFKVLALEKNHKRNSETSKVDN